MLAIQRPVRVFLTVAYDGAGLFGWQRQAGVATVQEHLEAALGAIFGQGVRVEGAGRTDAGVHAFGQVAHADLPRPFPTATLLRALNGNLPDQIVVRAVREVGSATHARFSALGKRYGYRFLVGPERPVLARGYYHWVRRPLDVDAMRAGARALVGEHDFASFATNPGYPRKNGTVRRIDRVHLIRRPRGVDLVVQGNGFLYNMVRTIAGTLRDIGCGKHPPTHLDAVLRARDRRSASATLEPGGLYLLRVIYPRDGIEQPGESAGANAVDG